MKIRSIAFYVKLITDKQKNKRRVLHDLLGGSKIIRSQTRTIRSKQHCDGTCSMRSLLSESAVTFAQAAQTEVLWAIRVFASTNELQMGLCRLLSSQLMLFYQRFSLYFSRHHNKSCERNCTATDTITSRA